MEVKKRLYNGVELDLKSANVTLGGTATGDIVAAVSGKRISVVGAWLTGASATTVQFLDDASNIGPAFNVQTAGSWSPDTYAEIFRTTAGNKLAATAGAGAVSGVIWYVEVP